MIHIIRLLQRWDYARPAKWLAGLLTVILSGVYAGFPVLAQPRQGFGANTAGGEGQPFYYVTNLNDSGGGSLRDALSSGNRSIVFDVGGEIVLSSEIDVKGAFITIDGFTAPSPVTLVNDGLIIAGEKGAHDVIVRGIRVQNAKGDSITIRDGAYNVVIDHISSRGATDGGIDITRGAHDITVQWSILAQNGPDHNFLSLVEYQARRVTFHHNLFVKGQSRSPQSGWDNTLATTPQEIVSDIRNNLIWDFSDYGTVITNNTKANVVNNFYYSSRQPGAARALYLAQGSEVYADGNHSQNGANVDSQGNQLAPFLGVPVDITDACTAAQQVVADAGVTPRDPADEQHLSQISLSTCAANPAITSPVAGAVLAGPDVTFSWTANGLAVRTWRLYIGSSQGAKDLHDSGNMGTSRTSRQVKRLPTDGREIWVQLRFDIAGVWQYADFQYQAALR
jgi:pectate lyase